MRRPAPRSGSRFAAPLLAARFILTPFVLTMTLMSPVGPAAADPIPLEADSQAHVLEVIDGDTVRVGNGREIRLVGIQGPKLPLGRPNFREWPMAREAQAHLVKLVAKKTVTLHFGGAREDRHGRILAHLVTADGIWVQGDMLEAGLARVYTFADNRALIDDMLAREAAARIAKRGIWSHPYYRIRTPDGLQRDADSFQLVEGRVVKAAKGRERSYLNFGEDYRTDFTVAIARADLKAFGRGFDPKAYEGKMIRVRGWVERINGPLIDVTHPEQIEVIEP